MPISILFASPIDYLRDQLYRPLGGAETAVVRLSRALASYGIDLEVRDSENEGFKYSDVLVVKRFPEAVFRNRHLFRRVYFWSPDDFLHGSLDALRTSANLKRFNNMVDGVFTISSYQYQRLKELGVSECKLLPSRYGVDLDLFPRREATPTPICIYTSSPKRGLHLLPRIWPKIRASVPQATLWVFSSMATYRKDDRPFIPLYKDLATLPGAIYFGAVPQDELYKALSQARVFLYPNTFVETASVATLEARAAGCAIVTTAAGALPESACGNLLVPPSQDCDTFIQAIVDSAICVLTDDPLFRAISTYNQATATAYDWKVIAREWLDFLQPTRD